MVESFLTQNMLVDGETAIADYLQAGQSNYDKLRFESFRDLLRDLMNADYTVRRLCKRFSLQAEVTQTAAFNSTLTVEDFAQRTRLVISVSVVTDSAEFTLQGTDDDGSNFVDISLVDDSGALGTTKTISLAAIGDIANSYGITKLYKKYRLKLNSVTSTTVTYLGYLISDVYTELHRMKTRSNIYRTLNTSADDVWRQKFEDYENLYQKGLSEMNFIIDIDDDELISEAEADIDVQNIVFRP